GAREGFRAAGRVPVDRVDELVDGPLAVLRHAGRRLGKRREVGWLRPVRWRDVDVAAATTACAHADPLPAPAVALLEHRAGGGDGGAAGGDGNLRAGLVVHLLDVARQLGGVDL